MAIQNKSDMFSEELDERRKKFIGDFGTGIQCCGKVCTGHIVDHATEYDPTPTRRGLFPCEAYGPGPSNFDRFNNFRVYHKYSCERCGLMYDNVVIEGTLGYIPHERQQK